MMRYPGNTVQQTPPFTGQDVGNVLAYAQPVADIENARAMPQIVNLVGLGQSALIYVSDRPINSSITDMLATRPAPTAPRAVSPSPRRESSPAQASATALQSDPMADLMASREFKMFAGFVGTCIVIGAGAAVYKHMDP